MNCTISEINSETLPQTKVIKLKETLKTFLLFLEIFYFITESPSGTVEIKSAEGNGERLVIKGVGTG